MNCLQFMVRLLFPIILFLFASFKQRDGEGRVIGALYIKVKMFNQITTSEQNFRRRHYVVDTKRRAPQFVYKILAGN